MDKVLAVVQYILNMGATVNTMGDMVIFWKQQL